MTSESSQTQLPLSSSPSPHVQEREAALPPPVSDKNLIQEVATESHIHNAQDPGIPAPFILDLSRPDTEGTETIADLHDDIVLDVTASGSVKAEWNAQEEANRGDTAQVSSGTEPKAEGVSVDVVENGEEKWVDPLGSRDVGDAAGAQDVAVVVEEDVGDQLLDANGRLLFPDNAKPSPTSSHIRIDMKGGSPQPWDLLAPPSDEGRKAAPDFDSANESRKYNVLQSSAPTRPLIPKSAYYYGPPPPDSAFGTPPMGHIGLNHPREIVRIERDYTGGELIQFAPIYPLELEGRINPTQFLESINSINELLISAHSLRHALFDNLLVVASLQISRFLVSTHFERELERLRRLFDELNVRTFNPNGLNILWPGNVAFLFVSGVRIYSGPVVIN